MRHTVNMKLDKSNVIHDVDFQSRNEVFFLSYAKRSGTSVSLNFLIGRRC